MDSHRFDALTKHLYIVKSRREGLRVLMAGLAAGAVKITTPDDAAAICLGTGAACQGHCPLCECPECCCSGRCIGAFGDESQVHDEKKSKRKAKARRRRRKKKKKDKNKKPQVGFCDCSNTREECNVANDCCSTGEACGNNSCGEQSVCCRAAGGNCTNDCDCCGLNRCVNGACGPSDCLPGQVICPPGFFEACCPASSTCASFGCVTDEPGACPAGADTCARPAVFCGGPPVQPQDCACFLDLTGSSFCSLGFSCDRLCITDADCETAPGNPIPGSRCVRCPATCGHNGGVCASPCPA